MRTPNHIEFNESLDDCFEQWAMHLGRNPKRLRASVIKALSTDLESATLLHLHRPHPPVFRLRVGSTAAIFTIEPHALVVRGFDPLPSTNPEAGFEIWYFCDNSWPLDEPTPVTSEGGGV